MHNYRVLYAEDDPKTQSIFKRILETLFAHVATTSNGNEALESFQNEKPDLVVTDINMPEKDGLELSNQIKSASPETPIIIISAYNDYSKLSKAIELEIDAIS